MSKRTIAVFTGNRAEYGLQLPILKAIQNHKDLECKLIVSGAHLDNNFGRTLSEIKSDGFNIDAEVVIQFDKETKSATANAIGSGIISMSAALEKMNPDIVVVYADRFEGFAAVIASTQMNFPTAHIEGGDLTEGGALDDSVRHAMTKLSHLHFTTNIQATNRLLSMGEEPWRVHTVGFPAIDLIQEKKYSSQQFIVEKLGLNLSKPIILFTQHSVTTEFEDAVKQLTPSLTALIKLANEDCQIIITYPNNDAGGLSIISEIEKLKTKNINNIQIHQSLGRSLYHGVLALSLDREKKVVCVGNSSSGIKETPIFGCPTVNIGSRQLGRLRGANVTDVEYNSDEIYNAIYNCINDTKLRQRCFETNNPYYLGDAGIKIAEVLSKVELNTKLIRKAMTLKGEVKDGWFR